MKKYGKSYTEIKKFKNSFIEENEQFVQESRRFANIYSNQPKRDICKICGSELKGESFSSHELRFIICNRCGHVNGEYKETYEMAKEFYEKSDYDLEYKSEERDTYNNRIEAIYKPKMDFMLSCLEDEIVPSKMAYLDVGAGSGYFVGALAKNGLKVQGIEISDKQVDFGNRMLGGHYIESVNQREVPRIITDSSSDVISFIGVLEHFVDINEIFDAIRKNHNIKYIYFSVPMFSYSVITESLFPNVYNRLLGADHTHVFTDSSLEYMYKMNNWEVLGEWRFGTDAADVMRSAYIEMVSTGNDYLAKLFENKFEKILDDIQLILDKEHFCSEIHVLAKKRVL